MSNRRVIVLLLVGIGLLVAVDVFLRYHGAAVQKAAAEPLLNGVDSVDRVTITRRNNQPVVLERRVEWMLERPFKARADDEKVLRMLDALAFSTVLDRIAESELRKLGHTRADFIPDTPVVGLGMHCANGRLVRMRFGFPTPSGEKVYVDTGPDSSIFTVPVRVFEAVDREADHFRRRALFDIGVDDVIGVDMKAESKDLLSLVRREEKWQTQSGGRVHDGVVKKLLGTLLDASVDRFVWPMGVTNEALHVTGALLASYGLDLDKTVTVSVKVQGGSDQQITFGKPAEEGSVYALVQNDSAIVTLPAGLREAVCSMGEHVIDRRLFPVAKESVAFLSLTQGDWTISLSRGESGNWRIDAPISAPADRRVVEDVLTRLEKLTLSDTAARGVAVSMSTNLPPVVVPATTLIPDGDFMRLRSLEMLCVSPSSVKRIVRRTEKGALPAVSVTYDGDTRVWSVEQSGKEKKSVDVRNVEKVLSALNPLLASRHVSMKVSALELAKYGLDAPFMIIAVDSETSVRRNLLIGFESPSGGRYATIGSSDAIFELAADVCKVLALPLLTD